MRKRDILLVAGIIAISGAVVLHSWPGRRYLAVDAPGAELQLQGRLLGGVVAVWGPFEIEQKQQRHSI